MSTPLHHSDAESAGDSVKQQSDLDIRRAELDLRAREVASKIATDRRSVWLTSPLLVTVTSALFGVLGAGFGAVWQGYTNTTLERDKFEFSLITKAVETSDQTRAAANLRFLAQTGILKTVKPSALESAAADPKTLPTFLSDNDKDLAEIAYDIVSIVCKASPDECRQVPRIGADGAAAHTTLSGVVNRLAK